MTITSRARRTSKRDGVMEPVPGAVRGRPNTDVPTKRNAGWILRGFSLPVILAVGGRVAPVHRVLKESEVGPAHRLLHAPVTRSG